MRMRQNIGPVLLICVLFGFTLRVSSQQLPPIQESRLKFLLRVESHLTTAENESLSRSTRDSLSLAHQLFDSSAMGEDDEGSMLFDLHPANGAPVKGPLLAQRDTDFAQLLTKTTQDAGPGLLKISHPEIGLQLSRLGGFTQSGSSTARCGENIVAGYSSGVAGTFSSILPSLANPDLLPPFSQIGIAYSVNGGSKFEEISFLNAGPSLDLSQGGGELLSLGGNASVACANPQQFYIADTPFLKANFTTGEVSSGVGINTSTDGGAHWGEPRPAILKNQNHLLDSAWLVIDQHHPNRLYVSYLDFDFDTADPLVPPAGVPRCPNNTTRIAAELVNSQDGGKTWSSPAIIREDCLPSQDGLPEGFHVGSTRISIGADGRIYATYLLSVPIFDATGTKVVDYDLLVAFKQSSNNGLSFEKETIVSNLVQIGDGSHSARPALQGLFTVATIPVVAADPVKHGGIENLYVVWSDGRNHAYPDAATARGTYNFGDIVLSRSTDGGLSWSAPIPVSPVPKNFTGAGRDQFLPAISVNKEGDLAICYYDRRNDPENNALDRYCTVSQDNGHSFQDIRQSPRSWIYGENWDRFAFWLGDYDSVAAPSIADQEREFFETFGLSANDVTGIYGRSVRHER